jgi:23S rRNA G2445 N2-methylase RlmL
LVDYNTVEDERAVAKKDRFDGEYKIYATDIDPEMIRISEDNAARAGQKGQIQFAVKDFKELALETGLQ